MKVVDTSTGDGDRTSKRFQDECFREITGFIQEMQAKHGGLTYARLFQYVAALHAVMMDIHLQMEELIGEDKKDEEK